MREARPHLQRRQCRRSTSAWPCSWCGRGSRAATRPTLWAALAFGSLGAAGARGSSSAEGSARRPRGPRAAARHRFLVLFPYLLYRFAMAFGQRRGRYERWVALLTASRSSSRRSWRPASRPPASTGRWWFQVYLVWFLVHWTVLSVLVSCASGAAGATSRTSPGGACAPSRWRARCSRSRSSASRSAAASLARRADTQFLGVASAFAFLLALSPPLAVRAVLAPAGAAARTGRRSRSSWARRRSSRSST